MALHVLVMTALVLVHDHNDAAFVLVGDGSQLADHFLTLKHVVVIVDQVGDAIDDDQVGVLLHDSTGDEANARRLGALVQVTVDGRWLQTSHLTVIVATLGHHLVDNPLKALGVAVRLLRVKEQGLACLFQAAAISELVAAHKDGGQDAAKEGFAVLPLGTHGDEVALGHRGHAANLDEVFGVGILDATLDEIRLHHLVVLLC